MDRDIRNLLTKYPDRDEWKELVFDLMNGNYDLEQYPMEESAYIADEFADGEFCERAYDAAYKAKQRLYKKLETVDDEDVELIFANLQAIGRYLAMKMYDYGESFSQKEKTL